MSIVDAIKKLREQLTGEPGKGASITDAILLSMLMIFLAVH